MGEYPSYWQPTTQYIMQTKWWHKNQWCLQLRGSDQCLSKSNSQILPSLGIFLYRSSAVNNKCTCTHCQWCLSPGHWSKFIPTPPAFPSHSSFPCLFPGALPQIPSDLCKLLSVVYSETTASAHFKTMLGWKSTWKQRKVTKLCKNLLQNIRVSIDECCYSVWVTKVRNNANFSCMNGQDHLEKLPPCFQDEAFAPRFTQCKQRCIQCLTTLSILAMPAKYVPVHAAMSYNLYINRQSQYSQKSTAI